MATVIDKYAFIGIYTVSLSKAEFPNNWYIVKLENETDMLQKMRCDTITGARTYFTKFKKQAKAWKAS